MSIIGAGIGIMPGVYLETTIPSFVIGDISPVLVTAAHQLATRQWWHERRHEYSLFTSALVQREVADGAAEFAEARLALLAGLPQLQLSEVVEELAERFNRELQLPAVAGADAVHLALACHHSVDYLLTWNLKHIANDRVRRLVARFHVETGLSMPTICTPEELLAWDGES